jgi:hypothetical protein
VKCDTSATVVCHTRDEVADLALERRGARYNDGSEAAGISLHKWGLVIEARAEVRRREAQER